MDFAIFEGPLKHILGKNGCRHPEFKAFPVHRNLNKGWTKFQGTFRYHILNSQNSKER